MNFKQLEYFCAVVEAESISLASRSLHISQPPISRQIAMLEDELGAPVFVRSSKGVRLTQSGELLYNKSQALLQDFHSMFNSIRDVNSGLKGLIKIGVIYSNLSLLLDYMKQFRTEYPQIDFYIRPGAPKELLSELENGTLHILFMRNLSSHSSHFSEKILGENALELVMTAELDPAPELDAIPMEMLRDCNMVLLQSDDPWGYSDRLIKECSSRNIQLRVVCQSYDTPMQLDLIQAGFGIGYLPNTVVKMYPNLNLYTKPIENFNIKTYPSLIWNQHLTYSSCVKLFISQFDVLDQTITIG